MKRRVDVVVGARPQFVMTLQREAIVQDPAKLEAVLNVMIDLNRDVIFPCHPRTRAAIGRMRVACRLDTSEVSLLKPVGFLQTVQFLQAAVLVVTDSGGPQKEAYLSGTPCVTVRDETEWVETVEAGWNTLVGTDPHRLTRAVKDYSVPPEHPELYGAENLRVSGSQLLFNKGI